MGSAVTQRDRVLVLLERAGSRGVTTGDFLAQRLPRFSARLMELRKQGHRITSERVREGSWRYILEPPAPFYPHHINSEDELLPPENESEVTLKLFESAA